MSVLDPEIIMFAGCHTVVVRGENIPSSELVDFMDDAFTALGEAIREQLFYPTGAGFVRYDSPVAAFTTVEAGFPVSTKEQLRHEIDDVLIQSSSLPRGRAAVARFDGDYSGLAAAWTEMMKNLEERGYQTRRPHWEIYEVAPAPERETKQYRTKLVALLSTSVN